ncbi:pectin lyase A 1 [Seiridium cupressi]
MGLRFVDVRNIVVQNIKITNLNQEYMWSGDALSFSGTSDIWIDHVTSSLVRDPLFHAVNVFAFNNGHLIEGGTTTGIGLYEGNHFDDVPIVLDSSYNSLMFASEPADSSEYAAYLGRDCVENNLSNSGYFTGTDTSFVSKFEG